VEVKEQIEDLGKQLNAEIKKALALSEQTDSNSKKKFEEINANIDQKFSKYDDLVKKQQEHLDALETRIKKGDLDAKAEREKTFIDHFNEGINAKQLDGRSVAEKLKLLKDRKEGVNSLSFEMKAAGNMLIGTNYTGSVGLTTWDNDLSRPARRQPFMRQLVTTRPINSLYVAYAELKNRDGAAGTVAEGVKKPQIDFDWVEASKKVEKIAAFIKTSKEALDDIVGFRSEINTELVDAVNLKLDEQILSGDGVTPNLTGILTYLTSAISVVGTPFATAVDSPNNFDVIRVAAAIVQNSFFNPNYAVMHPYDLASMELVKDANGQYVLPPFSTANGAVIAGVRVVANQGMTLGNFLVGDFSKDTLGIIEEINIQVGYENDDFTKNLVTILAEMRAVNYIKSNNLGAFTRGTFSTVKTAITAP
jgi:HK97 family phage major capsid protein